MLSNPAEGELNCSLEMAVMMRRTDRIRSECDESFPLNKAFFTKKGAVYEEITCRAYRWPTCLALMSS
ncbi:hypothetical protein M514_11159 [Trichuris suis]|uniref:Uncharacterized protein n=1 Tax=Trichuris suis TaxID=68888 RepID=A0A085LSN6_9BILA|nr:hypothetical protein M513_11159 [Trichuris suis]KFD65713.1 hypothetical protein M514_11159 [Trichuris suis]